MIDKSLISNKVGSVRTLALSVVTASRDVARVAGRA
jgi:hypothetical protein